MDDERLLVEQAKVDAESFGLLYERYVDEIYRFLHVRLGNAAIAEDVTAEVFVSALRWIGRYQDRGRPFSCWLYRIAQNAVADHYRRHRPNQELSDEMPDETAPVETIALRQLETAAIWRLVKRLPAQQQTAITLRFRDDLSAKDAARVMGKSEEAVKQLIFRGVARLRSQLERPPELAPVPSALAVS